MKIIERKHFDWYLFKAYKKIYIYIFIYTHTYTILALLISLQRKRKKIPFAVFYTYMDAYLYTGACCYAVHILSVYTIASVRTSHRTLTMNDMIQYSKFHFLIRFRKKLLYTLFLHLQSYFFYWKLMACSTWYNTWKETVLMRIISQQ